MDPTREKPSALAQWLRKETKSDDIDKGKMILDKYIRRKGYDTQLVGKNSYVNRAYKEFGYTGTDEMFNQIANGGSLVSKIGQKLIGYYESERAEEEKKEENTEKAIKVTQFSKKHKPGSDGSGIIVKGKIGRAHV